MLEAALDAAGLDRAVIGLGDADLYRQLLAELGVEGEARDSILERLATHDLVGLEAELSRVAGIGDEQVATCVALSQLRGGSEVLEQARGARRRGGRAGDGAAAARPSRRCEQRGVADRVQIDLGLLRDLGYYSGAILEVYDPALGHVLGGGGRYDGLLKRFGVDLPAAGFALYLERVHVAQMEEESRRGGGSMSVEVAGRGRAKADGPLKLAVPRGALLRRDARRCSTRSGSTPPRCAATRAR